MTNQESNIDNRFISRDKNSISVKENPEVNQVKHYATGTILPLGDGLTGKSVLSRLLIHKNISPLEQGDILLNTKKSYNIELEFSSDKVTVGDKEVTTSLQFYIFPGQRQKDHPYTTTFDEILAIFDCFPAMEKVSVILMIYDVARTSTLKSLEMWLKFALVKEWIYDKTLLILVSNKTDLQEPDEKFVEQLRSGIHSMITNHGIKIEENQIKSKYTSCINLDGISELRKDIVNWIAEKGILGVGTR
jgi:hypothetical protein